MRLSEIQDSMLINGHSLNVACHEPQGGAAVVLLHHGLGSLKAWKRQIPALVAAGYRVIAYDRWGYGASDPRPSLAVPDFADDLHDLSVLLDELAVDPAALVGHSDGGTLALYFALSHPKRVRALLVVAAHIYYEPSMLPGIMGLKERFEQDEVFRTGLKRMHGDQYKAVFWNWFNGWVRTPVLSWDMRPLLGQIACPTLVVQGICDEHATPQHARDLADAIPGAELWLAEGAGHMLPQENDQEFNARMLAFLHHGVNDV